MNDRKIIEDILQGNYNEFSHIMNKYHNELFKYIYKIVLNYDTTEDLLQEFFMLLYEKLHKYNSDKAAFRTWMYRLVTNYMISYLRKNKQDMYYVKDDSEFDFLVANEDNHDEIIIKDEQMKTVVNIMKQVLNPKQLNIMILHYFSGLSVKEISESLDIPIKTLYKSIKSSLNKIRKEVSHYE